MRPSAPFSSLRFRAYPLFSPHLCSPPGEPLDNERFPQQLKTLSLLSRVRLLSQYTRLTPLPVPKQNLPGSLDRSSGGLHVEKEAEVSVGASVFESPKRLSQNKKDTEKGEGGRKREKENRHGCCQCVTVHAARQMIPYRPTSHMQFEHRSKHKNSPAFPPASLPAVTHRAHSLWHNRDKRWHDGLGTAALPQFSADLEPPVPLESPPLET